MFNNYTLNDVSQIETPEFLIFESKVESNIHSIISLVGDKKRLVPHAKTHKSKQILNKLIKNGITRHKTSTLNELEVLAECEPEELILAYPISSIKKIERLQKIINKFPKTKFSTIASNNFHLNLLKDLNGLNGVYIDLDTGMNRTGIIVDKIDDFLIQIFKYENINVLGIHAYDGQMYGKTDIEERKLESKKTLDDIRLLEKKLLNQYSLKNCEIIVGGSWSFHFYIEEEDMKLSPGTWIYWDASNNKQKELDFTIAGVVLGQVIDENKSNDTVTVDIGAKAISSDPVTENRFVLVDKPKSKLIFQNEEHGIVKLNGESLNLGDYVLAQPGHACTVSPKYSRALIVNDDGIISGEIKIDARDRV